MKVTVVQLRHDKAGLEQDWQRLVAHAQAEKSEFVLLPEMPFGHWLANSRNVKLAAWHTSVQRHEQWLLRLPELGRVQVAATRPVTTAGGVRLNEAFLWDATHGYRAVHTKVYLPDEPGFWEATWYEAGDTRFAPTRCGDITVGFLICTELWFMQHARAYGEAGVHLLLTPRATPLATRDKWLAGGQAAAVISGAYSLSSNHASPEADPLDMAGCGWIIDPDGRLLGTTSRERPFLTMDVDIAVAVTAKNTYPRYVSPPAA